MAAAAEAVSSAPVEMQDHYSEYLAGVNTAIDVVATEDILNHKGVLITRRGTRIDHATSRRLIQHKLSRPLEQQVQLSDSIDSQQIYDHWRQVLARYPDLAQMHNQLGFEPEYQRILLHLTLDPLIVQKLTVLLRQLPATFEKALFCSWVSALVVKEMGLDSGAMQAVIVASLAHDLGFLHIDPGVLSKRGPLSNEEWRTLQAHVVIGQQFLAALPDMDQRVPAAVLEHHERCDGTGYPTGRTARLGTLGRVIGLADSLQAVRIERFAASGRTLRDAMPYLQMNDVTHSAEVYRAMSALLRKSGLERAHINPLNNIGGWAQRLEQRCTALSEIRMVLLDLQQQLLDSTAGRNPYGAALLTAVNSVIVNMVSAGIQGELLRDWLKSCRDGDEAALPDLNEIDLITDELGWQVNHVRRTAEGYCDKAGDPTLQLRQPLGQLMEHISRLRDLPTP